MRRQKLTSSLLVFALAGATILAGCTSQQQTSSPQPEVLQHSGPMPQGTKQQPAKKSGWPSMSSSNTTSWTHIAYPTGNPKTSSIGLEKGFPREARLNAPFEYQIIVTNLTDKELSGVVVRDEVEADMRVTKTVPQSQEEARGLHAWNLGTFKPHERKTIRVTATPAAEGAVGSCATVEHDFLLCNTVPVVSPKLRLVKTGPAEVGKCDEIVYNFEVSNTGTGTIYDVKINDPLPAGLTGPGGARNLTFSVGDIAAGATRKVSGKVRADRTGRFTNSATATGGPGGLTAQSGQVATVVRAPDLRISKACPTRQFVGRPLRYEITVTNGGDGPATNTTIEDQVPSNTQFVSASDNGQFSGGKVRWNVGTLPPGQSKKVTMVLNPSTTGTYRNTATAKCTCDDPVSDSCETVVSGIPAILLEVIDLEDPDEVGTTETYVITVTNQGSAADTNVKVVCMLEPNQEYVSSSGATRGTGRGNTITFDPLPTLPAKQKATWRIVVRNVKAGDVRFTTVLNSDQLTREVRETEATNVYE